MKYKKVVKGEFIERPNRFIAKVKIDGQIETVHVKNTGRCKELLLPGAAVILEDCASPKRKTRYDLIAVYKEGRGLINMDSQAPNKVVGEWLASIEGAFVKPEFTYGQSRVDFYMEQEGERYLIEVKGVTLERDGICYFPDAPTERGVKHIRELRKANQEGIHCFIAFVIQMEQVTKVLANEETHKEFAEELELAKQEGVGVLMLPCKVGEDTLHIVGVDANEELRCGHH